MDRFIIAIMGKGGDWHHSPSVRAEKVSASHRPQQPGT